MKTFRQLLISSLPGSTDRVDCTETARETLATPVAALTVLPRGSRTVLDAGERRFMCRPSRTAHKPSSGGPGPREVPIYRNWNVIQNSLIHQCGLVPATLRCDRLAVERKNR